MAVDIFLKLGDIEGDSSDAAHAGEIDVLSWSWGMTQSGTMHSGSGGGAGRVDVQDISFTKQVDKASPNLIKSCCNGHTFPEATLTVRKAGDNPLEYLVVELEQVIISSVSLGGSMGEELLTENVSLNFAQFKYIYTPQMDDGSGDAAIEAGYNIRTNEVT
jgi:type VI secretion system secreted protein Hcp